MTKIEKLTYIQKFKGKFPGFDIFYLLYEICIAFKNLA